MVLKNFIVLEGIDGSGTSTQLNELKKIIEENCKDICVETTCEPTDNPIGKFIRTVLKGETKLDPRTLAYLFAADRSQHIFGINGVEENCNKGKIVLSDRYLFSSLAYQSASCGMELPKALNDFFPLPEILFYFRIEPEISLKRVLNRDGENTEIFENLDYQKKTAQWYEKVIEKYQSEMEMSYATDKMKIIIVDGTKSIKEITENLWASVKNMPILNK